MPRFIRRAAFALTLPCLLLSATAARAQTTAPARAAPSSAAVAESQEHFRSATAAVDARNWTLALSEFTASNAAAESIAALDGIANAHYQLHHDEEAYAAYGAVLAKTPEIKPGQVALEQYWAKTKSTAEARRAEIAARRVTPAAASDNPSPAPVAEKPAPKRKARRDDDEDGEKVRTAENAVFLELAGSGFVYSVNFEHLFGDSGFSLRGGLSYMSLGASSGSASSKVTWLAVPLLGNYYLGGENHKLQLGVGATILYVTTSASSGAIFGSVSGFVPVPTAAIGYRYIPARGGFTFFVGLTPFIIPSGDKTFQPWAGMSFGAVF